MNNRTMFRNVGITGGSIDANMNARRQTIDDGASHWISVGNAKLKFTKCYSKVPALNIKNAIHFTACPFSGPIALAHSLSTTSWFVSIRTSGGIVLKDKIEIPDVFTIEWTRGHRLLVVDRRGCANLYSALGERLGDFHFSSNIREVRDVRVFTTAHDSGVALMDDQLRTFVVNSVNEPTIVWSMLNPSKEPPTAWTVLQPPKELTRIISVLGRDFYSGSQGEQLRIVDTAWALSDGQYARIVVSSDRSTIAVYHSSRLIQVVPSDLSYELSRIRVPGQLPIYRFGWLTLECIFLQSTPNHIQMFNISDENACYDFHSSEFVQIGVENDGIKLYSDTAVEFINVVGREEREVLGVASAADGALLHEAAQWLESGKSHQSYEYATQISDMVNAINFCIRTATFSWNTDMQKSLLKAARFGMAFTPYQNGQSYDTTNFVKVLRELRVLNEVRGKRIGMPITYQQFTEMGASCLLNRLIDIASYGVAIEICGWMGGDLQDGVDRVLLEWVRRAIQVAANEKNPYEMDMKPLEEKIATKLAQYPHVSIADAAKRAIDAKLPQLARLLIKRETDDSKQVNVLLQLGDVQEALSRAAAAQRPQLLHQVVRHLMAGQKRADYELAIRKIPMAQCLYQDLVRQESSQGAGRQMLALLEQASDFERQTMFHLDAAHLEANASERLNCLRRAKDTAHSMGDKGIEEVISDMAAFAPGQTERSEERKTIRETVIEHAADTQKVNQFKHQAKLTDKQVCLWTIEGLAKAGKMEQLFDMAQKKSPVGYVPFIKACMDCNRPDECKKYFAKVTGYEDLVAAHLVMGNYVSAAKIAYDRRDVDMLDLIFSKSRKNKEACGKVQQIVSQYRAL